jgi:ferrochelatase
MPLLHWTERQATALQRALITHHSALSTQHCSYLVRFAMRYGNPSIADAVEEIIVMGLDRLIVLPMYPQYSATSTASALDALFGALRAQRRVPAIHVVPPFYEHPAYLDAATALIRESLAKLAWQPDHFLLSFHGIPQAYAQRGDPYPLHVERTAQQLVRRLGWPKGRWSRTYQSLFGRAAWLKPYTEEKLKALAKRGCKRVFIATPGFTADCLETMDEVGYELREIFRHAGGEELHRCPCLNDHPGWIQALRTMVMECAR